MQLRLTIIFLLCTTLADGQPAKIDSIKKVLQGDLPAPQRALRMKDLAMYYESVDTAVSAWYYTEAARFAIKNRLEYEAAVIYHNMSFLYTAEGAYDRVISVLDSALLYANRTNNSKKPLVIASIHQAMSNTYRYTNKPKEAVQYILQAIGEFEQLKSYPHLVKSYYNLALLYKSTNEFGKQLECGQKVLQAAEKTGDPKDRFIAYSIQANAFANLTDYKSASTIRDSALTYYSKSYDPLELISFHLVSGYIDMNMNDLAKAKADFSASLNLAQEYKQVFSICESNLQLSKVLMLQKKFKEAERLLQAADSVIAKTKENSQKITVLKYYAELYDAQGRYKQALGYYGDYVTLNDSLTSLENRKYITELETRYETGKKEAQIQKLQFDQQVQQLTIRQKSKLNYILGGLAAALLAASLLAYKNHRQKQRLQRQRIAELETEKQLTATEAVLKGEELERTRLAKDLHDGLGGMLSGIKYSLDTMKRNLIMTPDNQQSFERSIDMLDSSIQEMRRVAHNMMPESLVNFGIDTALKEFCQDMTETGAIIVTYQSIGLQGETIDQTITITIYRIVQELINNIMKHAAAKNAIVQVSKTGSHVSITVEDDGKGFDASRFGSTETSSEGRGMGWGNIQNRIGLLKGRLDVKSLPGSGTSVLIEFNL